MNSRSVIIYINRHSANQFDLYLYCQDHDAE